MVDDIARQAVRFCEITKQLNGIYEEYAKSIGLTYTSLYILHLLSLNESCTQKQICEQLFLPKQTINSITMSFHKLGYVEMVELDEDRRHKAITLTAKGKEYVSKIIPKIDEAETHSMGSLNADERKQLLSLMERYTQSFSVEMKK